MCQKAGEELLIFPLVITAIIWGVAAILAFSRRSSLPQGLYRDLLAIGGFAALLAGFFVQVLFLPDYAVPRGGGDLASFLYPAYNFAASNIHQGVIPLWNPYQFGGMPFAADMQTGMFYPINFLTFWLVRPFSYLAMEGLAILHYFLAALFMYIYVRGLGIGRVGAFGAGAAFAFTGFTVAHLGHLNMLEAVVWLPLILFFFHKAVTTARITWALAAGAAFGISILPGHIQMMLYLGFFLALYWLWALAAAWRAERVGRDRWPRLNRIIAFPATLFVAIGLAAIQLLPSYELTSLSVRAQISYEKAIEYAASPLGLVNLLVPHFLGPNSSNFWGINGNLTEVYGYAGIVSMLMAGLALVLAYRRTSWRWFFALSALVFLLLSVGQDTVLHPWLYRFVPGFDKVRAPGRFLFFFDFAVAVLAGIGLDALTRPLTRLDRPSMRLISRGTLGLLGLGIFTTGLFYQALLTSQDKDPVIYKRVEVATSSIVLTVVFLALGLVVLLLHRRKGRWRSVIPWLAIAFIVVDLFSAGWNYNTGTPEILEGFNQPRVIQFLQQDKEPFRIDSATNVWDVWQPGVNLNYQISDVQGLFNPMTLNDFSTYWNGLGSRSSAAYDLLNARYVVAHKDVVLDWGKYKPVLTDAPKVNVYQNTKALPRAMIVPNAEVMPRDAIMGRLRSGDFNPTETIVIEQGASHAAASANSTRQVLSITYPTPNQVVIEAENAEPAYLFLADVMYPGWKARVDGKETPVLRADYLFRAVELAAGKHTVEFSFEPRMWTLGWELSTLFLVGLVASFGAAFVRRRSWK